MIKLVSLIKPFMIILQRYQLIQTMHLHTIIKVSVLIGKVTMMRQLKSFSKAIELEPGKADFYHNRGFAFRKKRDF